MNSFEKVALQADRLPGHAVVALFFEDLRPLDGPVALLDWRLDGQLTRMLLDGYYKGRAGEHVMLQNNGKLQAEWTLLVGGGKWGGLCRETYVSLIGHVLDVAAKAGFRELGLCLAAHDDADAVELEKSVKQQLLARQGQFDVCRLTCMPLSV